MSSSAKRAFGAIFKPQLAYLSPEDRYLIADAPPQYRFNLIGAGINGQEHLRVTHLEGRATIHGVYDPSPGSVAAAQREQARFAGEPLVSYDSLEAACFDERVDGLIIATPNYTHYEVVKVAAQSHKPILLEKPIATTVPDAYAITQIAQSYPAVFQVGLQYRFKPTYAEALHEIKERGAVGSV